jgi:hypothetical protein
MVEKQVYKYKISFLLKIVISIIKFKLHSIWLRVISPTPWYRALIISSWIKYKESPLFRYRWIEFSREMAAELYSYQEHKLFMSKVKEDKKLMKKILWNPYSILNEDTEDDFMLRRNIKF